jgi:hypothetical protein
MRVVLAFLLLMLGCAAVQAAPTTPWRIVKDHWDASDERGFGDFLVALGDSGCSSSQSCLRDPANPYRTSDRRFLDIDVDCAKLPYLLRAYYAWKNGLPFSYVDGVAGSRFGGTPNRIVSRAGMIDHGAGIDAPAAIRAMIENVYSGTFRTDASRDSDPAADFYAPALQPGSIRPGTVIYDTNAHVGIVYRVDASGRVYYMDAHPDFTITRSVYGPQFGQSPAALGGGLKNWRPLKLVNARWNGASLIGGHYIFAANRQIADFSLVQYLGTERAAPPQWRYNGARLGYYEYARVAVSGGRGDFNPVYELQATMGTLCNDLNDRRQAVEQAVANGISAKLHPSEIPANIYSSDDGTWESYATPARDARLRAAFVAFRQELGRMIGMWLNRDPRIAYDGLDLKRDLLDAYDRQSQECAVTYLSSDKHPVTLHFDDIVRRLFAMSFDPYNCVELRWGDDSSGCPDQAGKRRYYAMQDRQRHEVDRDGGPLAGPQDVDIRGLILSMPARTPFVQRYPSGSVPDDNRQSSLR